MSINYCYVTKPCSYCGFRGETIQQHTRTNETIKVEVYCSHCGLVKNVYEYKLTNTFTNWTTYKPNDNVSVG